MTFEQERMIERLHEMQDRTYVDGRGIKNYSFEVKVEANAVIDIQASSLDEALDILYDRQFKQVDIDDFNIEEVTDVVDYEICD